MTGFDFGAQSAPCGPSDFWGGVINKILMAQTMTMARRATKAPQGGIRRSPLYDLSPYDLIYLSSISACRTCLRACRIRSSFSTRARRR
ncbi:hypothetical protein DBB_15210 [Desulfoluna spongiiphila]|nr:hypothetical protein DBB_15210 [Desulfoluna spongiiphila]